MPKTSASRRKSGSGEAPLRFTVNERRSSHQDVGRENETADQDGGEVQERHHHVEPPNAWPIVAQASHQ